MASLHLDTIKTEDFDLGAGTVLKRNPGGGTMQGTQVGIHSFAIGQAQVTASWTPGSIAPGIEASTTVTVYGAALGGFAIASLSSNPGGLCETAAVSARNSATVTLANVTGGVVTLDSVTVGVLILKSR
jgi:hypothetical protein